MKYFAIHSECGLPKSDVLTRKQMLFPASDLDSKCTIVRIFVFSTPGNVALV
jgi:hypothetical protein